MYLMLIWAACLAVSGAAHASLTSDPAWARFRSARELADGGREFTQFNRFVFGTYRNLAVFAGPWARAGVFLEDFLRQFPNTRVHATAAALGDIDGVIDRIDPAELSLIVIDERFLDQGEALGTALARVDRLNADGFVVKIVMIVQDADVVLPSTAVYRGEFFEFEEGMPRKLKTAFENFGERPGRSRSWLNLVGQFKGRDRKVILDLIRLFLSNQDHVGVVAGTAADTHHLLDDLDQRVTGLHLAKRDRTALVNLAPAGGFNPVGLNVVRLPVEVDRRGQWPPPHEFFRLVHEVNMANARGTRVKLLVESAEPFEVPPSIRPRTTVIASTHGCESYLRIAVRR